jgi:hypothetical protein
MDRWSEQPLIISRQLAQLGLQTLSLSTLVSSLSETRNKLAIEREHGQPSDIEEWPAVQLAWAAAMQAQSCAYLAAELQVFAERLSGSQITCRESTYNALYDSLETFRRLLDVMVQSYRESNANMQEGLLPVLSTPLVEAIRSTLGLDPATITAEYTTRIGRAKTRSTDAVGDMS